MKTILHIYNPWVFPDHSCSIWAYVLPNYGLIGLFFRPRIMSEISAFKKDHVPGWRGGSEGEGDHVT